MSLVAQTPANEAMASAPRLGWVSAFQRHLPSEPRCDSCVWSRHPPTHTPTHLPQPVGSMSALATLSSLHPGETPCGWVPSDALATNPYLTKFQTIPSFTLVRTTFHLHCYRKMVCDTCKPKTEKGQGRGPGDQVAGESTMATKAGQTVTPQSHTGGQISLGCAGRLDSPCSLCHEGSCLLRILRSPRDRSSCRPKKLDQKVHDYS